MNWTWQHLMETKPRKKMTDKAYPYCGSWKCAQNKALVLKQNVPDHTVWCPDCGSSIVWRFDDKRVVYSWSK